MEAAFDCLIASLPEELLSAAISRTAPGDACRAAAVSTAFRAAADSDAVWSCFVPSNLPPLAEGELHPAPPSKKDLFMRLSDGPALLADGLVVRGSASAASRYESSDRGCCLCMQTMWLDRESGAKCYMLSARALCVVWGDTPQYWRWIPLADSR
jgi:hypothetical protein